MKRLDLDSTSTAFEIDRDGDLVIEAMDNHGNELYSYVNQKDQLKLVSFIIKNIIEQGENND